MQERKQPETLRLRAVMPALTVNDIQVSIAWYRDVLGFVVVEEYPRDGKLMGAQLRAGTVELLLAQDDFAKGQRQKGAAFRLFCVTARTWTNSPPPSGSAADSSRTSPPTSPGAPATSPSSIPTGSTSPSRPM
jgi:catechol 2,3-dioxygenase-like lactoylglutathione lyase family enzyme